VEKPKALTALNGLRFLAAMAVVVFHFAPRVIGYDRLPSTVTNLVNEGPAAVGFFFILSGFVLAHRYLQNGARIEALLPFYWSRFARLYPAYILAFVLFLPLAAAKYLHGPANHTIFFTSALLSVLMLQAWTPLAQAWNGPSWSLSAEAVMYVVFPLVGHRFLRLSSKKMLAVTGLLWCVPAICACGYLTGIIPATLWVSYLRNNPLLWLPLFLMGICATKAVPDWGRVSQRNAAVISTAAFLGLVLVAAVWPSSWSELFVTGGSAPLLVAIVVFFSRISGWATKIVGGAVFDRLGQASYIIYILQSPVWHYWQAFTDRFRHVPMDAPLVQSWQFALFIPFLIVLSLLVQDVFETPARIWLGTLKEKRTLCAKGSGVTMTTSMPALALKADSTLRRERVTP
jgi:peptidoglycan/LPS O-acetylase OafA/YrhL